MRTRVLVTRYLRHGTPFWSRNARPWSTKGSRSSFSSIASEQHFENSKHCNTCTCGYIKEKESSSTFACGTLNHENETSPLPPPLPEPVYSVHMRVLPSSLTALSSPKGRKYLLDTFVANTSESYWALMEQFVNQSDPAFCGITTLLMVLNAMSIDPGVRWRGGWRFYGSEDVLLDRCCLSAERIRRVGVNMEEFRLLGRCHGLSVQMKRPQSNDGDGQENSETFTVKSFRDDIRNVLTDTKSRSILVTSFSRSHLEQTGDGHFSPLAAFHEETDQVLLLDVARFKYAPYWVSVQDLYNAMIPKDSVTNQSRGWFLLGPPKSFVGIQTEDRRPAELVPLSGEKDACPVGEVKVNFCKANPHRDS